MTNTISKWLLNAVLICGLNLVNAQAPATNLIPKSSVPATPGAVVATQDNLGTQIIKKSTAVLEQAGKTFTGVVEKYSKMMQINPSSISNVIMYQFIDEWYGTRYQLGGVGKRGIDCSALLQFRSSEFVSNIANLKEGDLVFFRIHGGPVSHVGIYLHNNYFLHASSSRGVMISKLTDAYWTKVYVGGGRLKN
jgi:probable lipoprotein NlpC